MGFDEVSFRQNAEHYQGKAKSAALDAVDPREHLAIIQRLQMAELGNPALAITINPGSTPDHYGYTVSHTTTGQDNSRFGVAIPDKLIEDTAKIMGMTPEQFRAIQASQNDRALLKSWHIRAGAERRLRSYAVIFDQIVSSTQ